MLCKDGIVVVVNVLNNTVTNITKEQLKKILSLIHILEVNDAIVNAEK